MPALIPEQLGKILYEVTEGKSGKELDAATKEFMHLLQEKQLISKMPYIIEAFDRYSKKQQGIVDLKITTARKAPKQLVSQIEKIFGDKVETTVAEDSAIIGGVVAQAGNKILDASVKAQLSRMKHTL
ncbi:MAG: hypothetical protein HOE53_02325 [Candidatus Magasanikbacteria bacterium]|jgi:F-type H+-transporting ATPase subunit delta|nr:hypothetical protein [Candidatus Magasanikbacteria bacterium]